MPDNPNTPNLQSEQVVSREKPTDEAESMVHEGRNKVDEVLTGETKETDPRLVLKQKVDAMREKYRNSSFKWAELERDSKPEEIRELLDRLEAADITPDDFQAYYAKAVDLYRRKLGKPQGIPHAFQLVNVILNMQNSRKQ